MKSLYSTKFDSTVWAPLLLLDGPLCEASAPLVLIINQSYWCVDGGSPLYIVIHGNSWDPHARWMFKIGRYNFSVTMSIFSSYPSCQRGLAAVYVPSWFWQKTKVGRFYHWKIQRFASFHEELSLFIKDDILRKVYQIAGKKCICWNIDGMERIKGQKREMSNPIIHISFSCSLR